MFSDTDTNSPETGEAIRCDMESTLSYESWVRDWGAALKKDAAGGRANVLDTLSNLIGHSEPTADLASAVASFREVLRSGRHPNPADIDPVVDRIIAAAIDAGPNAGARALLMD